MVPTVWTDISDSRQAIVMIELCSLQVLGPLAPTGSGVFYEYQMVRGVGGGVYRYRRIVFFRLLPFDSTQPL